VSPLSERGSSRLVHLLMSGPVEVSRLSFPLLWGWMRCWYLASWRVYGYVRPVNRLWRGRFKTVEPFCWPRWPQDGRLAHLLSRAGVLWCLSYSCIISVARQFVITKTGDGLARLLFISSRMVRRAGSRN